MILINNHSTKKLPLAWFVKVTNKVFVVSFTKRNLLDTNPFSIFAPPKKSLLLVTYVFFWFQHCQTLKFFYPF